jgi:hypothetical protein
VAGLSEGATRRTVDGTSAGRETTTGSNDRGRYTLRRVVGDTIRGVVIPVPDETFDTRPYPVAGTVIRAMEVTLAYGDRLARSSSRREVVTFDGSDTATLVITVNGVSKTCSLPLPYGRPVCEE